MTVKLLLLGSAFRSKNVEGNSPATDLQLPSSEQCSQNSLSHPQLPGPAKSNAKVWGAPGKSGYWNHL